MLIENMSQIKCD